MAWYKVNWDVGIDQRKGCVGLGAVVRDHQGVMRAAKSQTIYGYLDPTAAEAMVAALVVKLCSDLGFMHVQVEGDA